MVEGLSARLKSCPDTKRSKRQGLGADTLRSKSGKGLSASFLKAQYGNYSPRTTENKIPGRIDVRTSHGDWRLARSVLPRPEACARFTTARRPREPASG